MSILQSQKFYKIKVKQNILRQALFTDKIVIVFIITIIFLSVFLISPNLTLDHKIILSIILSGIVLIGLSIKIDGQNFYEVLFRAIKFTLRKKHEIFR